MFNGLEFNTKISQFDEDHIQIDFSSQYYKRGYIKDVQETIEEGARTFTWHSGGDPVFVDTDSQGHIIDCRSYSSAKRTKQHVYQLARSNKWDYFCTFTFSPDMIDRSDFKLCQKRFCKFFENLKRKFPDLKYLFIVEMHSNGEGIHFHGLIYGIPLDHLLYLGKHKCKKQLKDGRKIWSKEAYDCYSLPEYKLGYNSLSPIADQGRVCGYVCKYITKTAFVASRLNVKGQHLYFCSKNCRNPEVTRLCVRPEDLYKWISEKYPDFQVTYSKTCESYAGNWVNYIQIERKK